MYFYICRSIVKNWSLPVKPDSYALHNNFFYVLLFFVFHFRRNCMAFMTILTLFFFSSSKRFCYLSLVLFVLFFFRKILMFFTNLFSRPLFVFLMFFGSNFFICEKNIAMTFYALKTS